MSPEFIRVIARLVLTLSLYFVTSFRYSFSSRNESSKAGVRITGEGRNDKQRKEGLLSGFKWYSDPVLLYRSRASASGSGAAYSPERSVLQPLENGFSFVYLILV